METFNFPFQNLQNDEFLKTIFGFQLNSNNTSQLANDSIIFHPPEDDDDDNDFLSDNVFSVVKQCSYVTLDEQHLSISKNELSILQINCRGLSSKFDHLKTLLANLKINTTILALSETWLADGDEKYFNIPNYTFISKPRIGKRGGGVGLYISDKLSFNIRNDLLQSLNNVCEYLVVEIKPFNCNKIVVASIYRAPGQDLNIFNVKLAESLTFLDMFNKSDIFLAGDWNVDLLRVNEITKVSDFYNAFVSNGLLPFITRPTRITATTATLIDNIFSNCVSKQYKSYIICDDISDHFPTLVVIDCKTTNIDYDFDIPKDLNIRLYNKHNLDMFKTKLYQIDWNVFSVGSTAAGVKHDTNFLYNLFATTFENIFNESFPLTQKHVKNKNKNKYCPWLTPSLMKCCRKKSRLLNVYKNHKTTVNFTKYKLYRNCLKSTLRSAESMYYISRIQSNSHDLRGTWKVLNSLIRKSSVSLTQQIFLDKNIKIESPIDIANGFNNFFVNIGPELAKNISNSCASINDYLPPCLLSSFVLLPTDTTEVKGRLLLMT